MDKVLNLYKNPGETPLECILRYKKERLEFENVPMTYAGRLDPLAEGVLLVLAGEAVHRKEEFLNLKKEYEVEVLFGVSTDTFDVLGLLKNNVLLSQTGTFSAIAENVPVHGCENLSVEIVELEKTLKKFIWKNIFEYPAYSSKPVNGKPLFSLARSGELDDVQIPKREVEIFNLEILNCREVNSEELLKDIENKINKVGGDFRQDIIVSKWREFLGGMDCNFKIAKIMAEVSSGTYMRTLAHEWGKALGVPALAYHIVRTKVGDYEVTHNS